MIVLTYRLDVIEGLENRRAGRMKTVLPCKVQLEAAPKL